jgi:hypothetical protein
MSSGSLAGGIGVWGASLRPVGFGWQAGIMAAPELWALLLSLRGWRAGLASGDTRPSARGCPRWVALLRGDFCSSLFGVAAGLASGDTRPSARGCPRWVAVLRGDSCSSLFGVAAGLASRWVALLRGGFPSLLPSFLLSFETGEL